MQNLNYFTPANDIGIWRCKKKWKQLLQNMVNSNLNNPKEMLVQTHFNAVLSQTTTVLHIGEMWEIIMQNTK